MNSPKQALVHFLADAKWTDEDFEMLGRLVGSPEGRRYVKLAHNIRQATREMLLHFTLTDDAAESEVSGSAHNEFEQLYALAKELLLEEARLKPSEAVALLSAELSGKIERPSGRMPFARAIAYFLRHADGATLLSAAERVKDRVVRNTTAHAWHLDDEETTR